MKRLRELGFRKLAFLRPSQKWVCGRLATGNACGEGPRSDGTCSNPAQACTPRRSLEASRRVLSRSVAIFVAGFLGLALTYAGDLKLLMPGPVTTAHSSIEKCSGCHTRVADGQLGWMHSFFASTDPARESKACLTCHKMSTTALNPHGLAANRLETITRRLQSVAASFNSPKGADSRRAPLPAKDDLTNNVFCATCHKEHQGKNFDLKPMPGSRCKTCHLNQFDDFQSSHPKFGGYPYKRRTRIFFDHASHFGKHIPKLRAENAKKTIPRVCADCHAPDAVTKQMGVKPFKQICASCHLGQITGAERATGPKGVALLTLPGLDVASLREKKAVIGQWPEESEAEPTPFMNLLIGWDEERRQLLTQVSKLDLLDLGQASQQDIYAVERFVWEVKELIYTLATSSISEIRKRLGGATGAPVDPQLIAKLTAALPRDVLTSAWREWLPDLKSEIAKPRRSRWKPPPKIKPVEASNSSISEKKSAGQWETQRKSANPTKLLQTGRSTLNQATVTPGSRRWRIDEFGEIVKGTKKLKPAEGPTDDDAENPKESEKQTPEEADEPSKESADAASKSKSSATSDDRDSSDLDAEAWAELGGWYRQDYAILYMPTGHKDGFFRAWLDYSGSLSGRGENNLASPVFQLLTQKDAQGQCTKCHSVDKAGERRQINWKPSPGSTKPARFTLFAHEPHFGLMGDKGCLTCHEINDAGGHQDTYKALDPGVFVSNFKPVKKEECASCHKPSVARSDCLLCHKYHVNAVTSPIMSTKIPEK